MNKPKIFVSAVTTELHESRERVAKALRSMGFDPIYQDIFPTDSGDLRCVLREKIDSCQGFIQVIGFRYGCEPPESDPKFGRVSYTQYELLYFRGLNRRDPWYFLIEEAYDALGDGPEPDERNGLQHAYRESITSSGSLYHRVSSIDQLDRDVRAINDELRSLHRRFRLWSRSVIMLLAVILLLVCILIFTQRAAHEQAQVSTQEMREKLDEIGHTRTRLDAELRQLRSGLNQVGLEAWDQRGASPQAAALADHLRQLMLGFEREYTSESLLESEREILELARASVREAAGLRAVWNTFFDSDVSVHLPVEERKRMYTMILDAFTPITGEQGENEIPLESRIKRAEVLISLADTMFSRRGASSLDRENAQKLLGQAEAELESIGPDGDAQRINLTRRLADLHASDGAADIAITFYQKVIGLCMEYRQQQNDARTVLAIDRNINSARRKLAILHAEKCESSAASEELATVLIDLKQMLNAHPDSKSVQRDWSVAMNTLIYQQIQEGSFASALLKAEEVVEFRAQMYRSQTGNERYTRDFAVALLALADVYSAQGLHQPATEVLGRAKELLQVGVRLSSGQDARMRETLGIVLVALARNQLMLGVTDIASSVLNSLEDTLVELGDEETRHQEFIDLYAELWHLRSLAFAQESRLEEAAEMREKALSELALTGRVYVELRLRALYASELLSQLPLGDDTLRPEVIRDGTGAIERIDAEGRSCLVPHQVRAAF